jgi:hypothetical protein
VGWQEARREVIRIAGKRLDEISHDDVPTLRASDLDDLSGDQRAAVLARLRALNENRELSLALTNAELAQVNAEAAQIDAACAAIGHEDARGEMQSISRLLTRALDQLEQKSQDPSYTADNVPAALTVPTEEACKPWPDLDLMAKFYKDNPGIGDSSKRSYRQAFREFEELIGRKPLGKISKADVKTYADYLRDRPTSRASGKLKRTSIKKSLSHIKNYFGWAAETGIITSSPAEGVRPRTATREERNGEDDRRAFTKRELMTLFDSPMFTGCLSRSRRAKKGREVFQDEKYWFWLISLLSGARTEEVSILPSTFVDLEGVQCLDFMHATKTGAGPRLIPILPELRKLGIENWAAEQARRGRGMVEGPNGSKDWSKWLNRYMDDIGLEDPTIVAYSLRHNFRQQLRASKLHPEIVDKVFGHEGVSVGAGYGRALSPEEARLVVECVKSPIPLDHLYPLLPLPSRRLRP